MIETLEDRLTPSGGPVIDMHGVTSATAPEQTAVTLDDQLTISDSSSSTIESAKVTVTANYQQGEDVLGFAGSLPSGVIAVFDSSAGKLTFTGPGTLSDYQALLQTVTFTDNADVPNTGARTVAFTVVDDNFAPDTESLAVSVPGEATPTVVHNTSMNAQEGATTAVAASALTYQADAVDGPSEVLYTLTTPSAHGTLLLNGNPLGLNGTFTQADINAGNLTYQNTGGDNAGDSFSFNVTDDNSPAASASFSISIFEGTPSVVHNIGLSVNEGASATVQASQLTYQADTGDAAGEVLYTLTSVPAIGSLYDTNISSTTPLNIGDTFTQADINAGFIVYTSNASSAAPDSADSFAFQVTDDASSAASDSFSITVSEATPSVVTNKGMTVNEGDANTSLQGLLSYQADAGDPTSEVVYTLTALPTAGFLYNTNVSATTPLHTGDTFTQADIDSGFIVYTNDPTGSAPDATDSFSFTVTDDSSAAASDSFSITINEGTPTVVTNAGMTVNEGNANSSLQGLLSYQADAGDPTSEVVYTLTSVPAAGFLYNTNVSSTTPLGVGNTFTQADIDSGFIVYTNDAASSSPDTGDGFNFNVTDDNSSAASDRFGITINESTPTVVTNAGLTVNEGDPNVALQGLLGYQADKGDPASEVVYTLSSVPASGFLYNLNVSSTTPLGVGDTFTQADIDNGSIVYTNDPTSSGPDSGDGFSFTVTDDSSAAASGSFSITINEGTPIVISNAGLNVNEGDVNVSIQGLLIYEGDSGDPASELTYTLTGVPAAGFLYNTNVSTTTPLGIGGTFTQDDIDNGFIVYTNDPTSTAPDATDAFNFIVADDNADVSGSFGITINEATPTVVTNAGLTVNEGDANVSLQGSLSYQADSGDPTSEVIYTLTSAPAAGFLYNANVSTTTPLGVGSTFTQADIDSGFIVYTNNPTSSAPDASDGFSFHVTDDNSSAASASFSITINEATPTVVTNAGLTVNEGDPNVPLQGLLRYQADSGDPSSEVVYTLSTVPAAGFLYNLNVSSTTPLGIGDTFTQADIDNGAIVYTSDATSSAPDSSDGFSFTVTDDTSAAATDSFSITINEATPIVVHNAGLTVSEGAANVSLQGLLNYEADSGDPATEVVYTLTSVPSVGFLYNTNVSTTTPLGIGDTFTQDDIDNGFIVYTNDPTHSSPDSGDGFNFSVTDDNSSAAIDSFSITINEATPTVATNAGLTVNEGDEDVSLQGLLSYQADAGDPASEVVYTLTSVPSAGFLYNTNVSATTALGVGASFTQADIDSGFIVYTNDATSDAPDDSDGFSFKVTDDTSAAAGNTFSISITEATPTVATNIGLTVNEGDANVSLQGLLSYQADSGDPASEVVYTLNSAPAAGFLYNTNVSTTTPLGVGSAFTQADIDNGFIVYTNDSASSAPDSTDGFSFTVTDGASAGAPDTFAISINEGTPTVVTNAGLTVNEGNANVSLQGLLSYQADSGDPSSEVVYTLSAVPAHGSLYNTNVSTTIALGAGDTFTQADLDNGFIVYTNDGLDSSSDSFAFTVTDDNSSAAVDSFSITIKEGTPTVVTNAGLTVNEGDTNVPLQGLLSFQADNGDPSSEVLYTLSSVPVFGSLYNTNVSTTTPLGVGDTFTQADIDSGFVVYSSDTTSSAPDSSDGFNFTVSDDSSPVVNDAFAITIKEATPTVVTNAGLTVNEGAANASLQGLLSYQADSGDPSSEVVYTLTSVPAAGSLYNINVSSTIPLAVGNTFTQADLDSGFIAYTNNATSLAPDSGDSFRFNVTDDNSTAASATFSISITEATPTLGVNAGVSVVEGNSTGIDGTALAYNADAGDPASEVVYTVTAVPAYGNLLLSGNSLSVGSSFTQADINSSSLSYQNTADPAAGLDSFSFDVSDDNSLTVSDTFTITVTEPVITVTAGNPVVAVEGLSTGGVIVASFTHAAGSEPATDFTASIDWGDGTAPTLGNVTQPGGVGTAYVVQGNHLYAEESANWNIQVRIQEDLGANDTGFIQTDTATVSDQAVIANPGLPISANEGMSTNLVLLATFTDPGGAEALSEYTADVNWGDSTPLDNNTVIVAGANGQFSVLGNHVYGKESPVAGFLVTTTIHHQSEVSPSPLDTVVNQTAIVSDQQITNVATANLPATGQEGVSIGSVSGIATFTDPAGAGSETTNDFTATINWGDNTTDTGTIVALGNGDYQVDAPAHTYAAEGTYAVSLTLQHDSLAPVTAGSQLITISDQQISAPVAANLPANGLEGASIGAIAGIATFTDPAGAEAPADYTATIDWGDGTTSAGMVTNTGGINFRVDAPAHTYANEATYTVKVTVQHGGLTALASSSQSITIADQQLTSLASANLPANGVEGTTIGAIAGIATFTDPAGPGAETLADFSATISWGDSTTSAGTIVALGSGNYRVDAPAHTYAEEKSYTVNVALTHDALGSQTTPDQSIVIGDPAVALTPTAFAATQGVSFTGKTVATFTDPGGAELVSGAPDANEYNATIDWGDGSAATAGAITYNAGTFSVQGDHTYANPGSYLAAITVSHGTAADATTTTLVTVSTGIANKLAVANIPATITAGQSFNFQVDVEDQFGNLVTIDHSQVSVTPTAPFTSGSTTVQASGGIGSFNAMSIQAAGNYTLTFSDGILTTTTASISVTAAAPAKITAQAGTTPQSATVGQSFGTDLSVLVTDAYGNPLSGVPVTFTAPGSGASANFGTGTVNTNGSGIASTSVSADTVAGSYLVTATAAGLSTTFQLTNLPGVASQLVISPIPSTSAAGQALPTFQVQIEDGDGNVETADGAALTLSLNNGGVFTAGTTTAQAGNGVATFSSLVVDKAGPYTLTVTDAGDNLTTTTPITINPSSAATLSVASGSGQTAAVETLYAKSLKALVTDVYGNPVPNVTVTFTAPAAGASGNLGSSSVQTDAFGIASTTITANTVAGSFTVGASALGNILSTSFLLTNAPGAPAALVLGNTVPASITAGQTLPSFQVTVEDADGNVVTGDNATLTAALDNGGSFTSGNASVQAVNGVAVFSGLVAQKAGSFTMTVADAADSLSITSPLTVNPAAALITPAAGNGETATVGTVFGSLQAKVTDAFGNPQSGVNVTFTAPSSGPGGMFTVSGSPSLSATVATDASGVATAPVFTANVLAGSFTVTAAAAGIGVTQFNLVNLAGSAANIVVLTGTPQSTMIGNAFAAEEVLVTDASGNAVSGASVTFAVVPGATGAAGTFAGSATVLTNALGVAVGPALTANTTAGSFTVTASVAGVGSPATFALTNTPGAAATVAPVGSTSLNAPIGLEYGTQLQVVVTDALGNPVANVPVMFAAPANGPSGTFSAATSVVTNALGIATAPNFTANRIQGTYNVTATAAGIAGPVTFHLTNTAIPASIRGVAGSAQKATVTSAYAKLLQAKVLDAHGHAVSGITVVFSLQSASGAGGTFASSAAVVTNSSGIATAPAFTANQTAGTFKVVASVAGVAGPALFTLTNTAGAATTLTAVPSTAQSAVVGKNYSSAALMALVTDTFGNPVAGVKVTFTAPSTGPGGKFSGKLTALATTAANGIAKAPTFTANSLTGSFTVTATVSGIATPVTFTLTNLPAPHSKPRLGGG